MKQKKMQIIAVIIGIVAIGLGLWAFSAHRAEQERIEQQRAEAASVARVVKDTYSSFFDLLRDANGTSVPLGVKEFMNSPGGKNISDSLRKQYLDNPKTPVPLLGCRHAFSDELIAEGFMFGTPDKQNGRQYVVSVSWNGDDSSRGTASVAAVTVDASNKKIVKFDCSAQDKIDAQTKVELQKAVNTEQRAE